jgi:hypothetical protein
MCALYEGCALASLVGSTLVGSWRLTQNLADFNRPARRWLRSVGAELGWSSLYRPRDNTAMLHGGLAKLMRMSTRNMWWSNGPKTNRQQ